MTTDAFTSRSGARTAARPTWSPSTSQLDDVEMLLHGGYGPLRGFLGPVDVAAVIREGRLADATPWPVPVTLAVDAATARSAAAAGMLDLLDEEGTPVATLRVDELWPTTDLVGVAGPLTPRQRVERGCHRGLRRSAADVVAAGPAGTAVLGVPLRRPLSHSDLPAVRETALSLGAHVRLLPLTGWGNPDGLDAAALVFSCVRSADELTRHGGSADVVPVALPRHPGVADDRRRTLVAMVARAYGATHVPGPLPAVDGMPAVVELVPGSCNESPRTADGARPLEWALACGLAVLFTGLSGSGKSTLANAVRDVLGDRTGRAVTMLDGDVVRRMLSAELTFSRAHRELNVRRIGFVASEIARHGGIALCAPIAPYAAGRAEMREMVEQAGGRFVLVHVSTPLEVCEGRDRKGLYAKARRGEIPEFTGVSDLYEPPNDADLVVDTSRVAVGEAVDLLLHELGDVPAI